MDIDAIIDITEEAWFTVWEMDETPTFSGSYVDFVEMKENFLKELRRRLELIRSHPQSS